MKLSTFLPLLALLVAVGCDTSSNHATSLTEPTAVASAAASSASAAAAQASLKAARAPASSTTCAAYQERLDAHQRTLERFPGDEAATEAVATYASLIADACS